MKYKPNNGEELKALCDDESVYLGDIDTSLITDMSELFDGSSRTDFSGIESWDVSNVENMSHMFKSSLFNHPIDSWDVSKVRNMSEMFYASHFNQPLNSWDVSNVENMNGMFRDTFFNQPLDSWDVSKCKDMSYMFFDSFFNHPLNSWKEVPLTNLCILGM